MKIVRFESLDSTNKYAKTIASETEAFTVVTAKRQTQGRGRLERRWESPEGGLWLSIILKPQFFSSLLSFIAALAVLETLKKYGIISQLKWPNDILVGKKKIGGILLEKHGDAVIVGIGLNLNVSDIETENWTSVLRERGERYDPEEVLDVLIDNMRYYYSLYGKREFSKIIEEWKQNSCTLGKNVIVETIPETLSGKAIDIDENGFLILDNGKKINAGDVVHLL
ncbi:MAG: biotin--[acetyl-CoA-carboxylase] ligase [Euryarchaeota archaeon]|nr:biotin--[acetyl-CoA-carboxylase] ligase [Euryarchaeota archaeon]